MTGDSRVLTRKESEIEGKRHVTEVRGQTQSRDVMITWSGA